MNRRDFLRLMLAAPAAAYVDYEQLLWVPGEKTIFIPSGTEFLSMSQIVALEMERILPHIGDLFDRDSYFFKAIGNFEDFREVGYEEREAKPRTDFTIPLQFRPYLKVEKK
jgi:hypothetical protein